MPGQNGLVHGMLTEKCRLGKKGRVHPVISVDTCTSYIIKTNACASNAIQKRSQSLLTAKPPHLKGIHAFHDDEYHIHFAYGRTCLYPSLHRIGRISQFLPCKL